MEWKIIEISSRKFEIPREYFMQRCAQKKDRNGMGLTEAEDIKKRRQEQTEDRKKIFMIQITKMV